MKRLADRLRPSGHRKGGRQLLFLSKEIAVVRESRFHRVGIDPTSGLLSLTLLPGEPVPHLEDLQHTWIQGHLKVYAGMESVSSFYRDDGFFAWRGKRFRVDRFVGDHVDGIYEDADEGWASDQGLKGSHYDGFTGSFPLDEVDDLHIERTDLITKTTTRIQL